MRRFRPALVVTLLAAGTLIASPAAGTTTAHYRHERGWDLNDPKVTPGAVRHVSRTQVCKAGYASTVARVSTAVKNRVFAEYGITHRRAGQYEIDHLIAIGVGGSSNIKNLWPEPNDLKGSNTKDSFEQDLHTLVCSGRISLKEAQQALAKNWVKAYPLYYRPLPTGHNY